MPTYLKFIISTDAVMYIGKNIHKKTIKKISNHQKVYCYRYFVGSVSAKNPGDKFNETLYKNYADHVTSVKLYFLNC